VEVVGDGDEVEPGLLGTLRVGEELIRVMLLAHEAVAEGRHRLGQ
jgi:hypothetical protein